MTIAKQIELLTATAEIVAIVPSAKKYQLIMVIGRKNCINTRKDAYSL
jgi:hypothetical protein